MNYLSTNIKYLRSLKGLSQEQFADDLCISRSRISSYEGGRSKPSIQFLIHLSNYSQICMETLIKKKLSSLQ